MISPLRPEAGPFSAFEHDRMWDVAKAAVPNVPIKDSARLHEYDAYYYSHNGIKSLPVLRIRRSTVRPARADADHTL